MVLIIHIAQFGVQVPKFVSVNFMLPCARLSFYHVPGAPLILIFTIVEDAILFSWIDVVWYRWCWRTLEGEMQVDRLR